jgi:transcriptional regulator with XRE-family HTH domain
MDSNRPSFHGVGKRIREVRERLGLDIPELARQVGCSTKMLELIESESLSHRDNVLNVLERIAVLAGCQPEMLLFSETTLIGAREREAQFRAFDIILRNGWASGAPLIGAVFDEIQEECQKALVDEGKVAMGFRNFGKSLDLDEDKVYELVVRAKKRLM